MKKTFLFIALGVACLLLVPLAGTASAEIIRLKNGVELHGELVQFDPEVGYILGNFMPRDGMDGSSTFSTVQSDGTRTSFMYRGKPCRINTYGNSFTQCHQVSDGETWQEYLAAHLGEPVRNFGMGGFGFYQAYRRMLREEQTEKGAEYVMLYIWGDDHVRSR